MVSKYEKQKPVPLWSGPNPLEKLFESHNMTSIREKAPHAVIAQYRDRPAAADEMVPDMLPFEKSPIFPGASVSQGDQMWTDRLLGQKDFGCLTEACGGMTCCAACYYLSICNEVITSKESNGPVSTQATQTSHNLGERDLWGLDGENFNI